jgi:arylsulfatase
MRRISTLVAVLVMVALCPVLGQAKSIRHDAEYYILEAQNREQWAIDDEAVDEKLAAFREKNGGNPPNVLYILIDDIGFGDLGIPELNAVRGYSTPHINKFSDESMRFVLMMSALASSTTLAPRGIGEPRLPENF